MYQRFTTIKSKMMPKIRKELKIYHRGMNGMKIKMELIELI